MATETSSGFSSRYIAETNRNNEFLAVCYTFLVLDTIFILLFWYGFLYKRGASPAMRWIASFAWLFNVGNVVPPLVATFTAANGHHKATVPLDIVHRWHMVSKGGEYTYIFALLFSKLAILALYEPIFTSHKTRKWILGTGIFLIIVAVACSIQQAVICKPVAYNFNPSLPGGVCTNYGVALLWPSIPTLITDIIILVLPFSHLRKLHVGSVTKVGLFITFLTGSVGVATAIIRLLAFLDTDVDNDELWITNNVWKWTIVEPSMYMFAAILPTLRPLVRRTFQATGMDSFIKRKFPDSPTPSSFSSRLRSLFGSGEKQSGEGDEGRKSNEGDVELGARVGRRLSRISGIVVPGKGFERLEGERRLSAAQTMGVVRSSSIARNEELEQEKQGRRASAARVSWVVHDAEQVRRRSVVELG